MEQHSTSFQRGAPVVSDGVAAPHDSIGTIALLAEAGAPSAASALLALGGLVDADQRRFLDGPVVIHQNGWTDTLPDWMPRLVPAERVGIVCQEILGERLWPVGPIELACVMYPATLEAPMTSDMADLYIWGTGHAVARRDGSDPIETIAKICSRAVADHVMARADRLLRQHSELLHTIRRRVVEAARSREPKEGRRARPTSARPSAASARPEVVAAQFTMF